MKEIWKDIEKFEGFYQISTLGNVRSLDRIDSRGWKRKGSMKAKMLTSDGYETVKLNKNGVGKKFLVHRLVAMTFIPNPSHYPMVNHINENKIKNSVDNLEWCDVNYNNNYGTRNKRISLSLGKPIISRSKSGYQRYFVSIRAAARFLQIDGSAISKVLKGKLKHTGGYSFEFVSGKTFDGEK